MVKFPFALKIFVAAGVHWLKGRARLALASTKYVFPAMPLVALKNKSVRERLTLG